MLGLDDVYLAADAVTTVVEFGPIGLEGIDELLVRHSRKKNLNAKGLALLPEGKGWLYVEFGGDTVADAEAQAGAADGRAAAPARRAFDAPVPRPGRDAARVGRARVGARGDVVRSRRGQELGRLGGRGRAAGAARARTCAACAS